MTQQQPAAQSGKPGQITATMRAVPQAAGPKVLRIGIVKAGKVIEERVIKQRSHVTIGPSEKSMFVVPVRGVPPSFKLFELIGQDYYLNFLDGMGGRIAFHSGIVDLPALRAQAKKIPIANGHFYQVQIPEDTRGKVIIGEQTFLFQFVAPPPVQPKPQLPVAVQTGVSSNIDWTTTVVAAFSFLFHFGAVASIYSDWMDPVIDDELDVQQLIESVKQLPPPPPIETPKETTEAPTTTAAAATEAPKSSGGGGGKSSGGGKGSMNDARATALTNELNQLQVQMLASLATDGAATNAVLTEGNLPSQLLEGLANDNRGVGAGGAGGLNFGSGGGGVVRPGSGGGDRSLTSLGNTAAAAPTTAGSAQKVKGPTGNAQIGGASVMGGAVANASSVVAGMQAGFRRCYTRGLQEDPNMKGSVRITARIGPNGEVVSATSAGSGLSGSVIACVIARVQSAQFAAPEGGGSTVVIPVSFVSQASQ